MRPNFRFRFPQSLQPSGSGSRKPIKKRDRNSINWRDPAQATIPGIGPLIALTLAIEVDPAAFKSGRHLAAWLGLAPKEHSTAGKQRMGGISRAGNERLRQLLVTGATAVIKVATRPGNKLATDWLLKLLQRRPRKLAAVALANKMARTTWAMMTSGETYRHPPVAAVSA